MIPIAGQTTVYETGVAGSGIKTCWLPTIAGTYDMKAETIMTSPYLSWGPIGNRLSPLHMDGENGAQKISILPGLEVTKEQRSLPERQKKTAGTRARVHMAELDRHFFRSNGIAGT